MPPPLITNAERRRRLAHRHLLSPELRTPDLPTVVDALVALHSSDPVTVYLTAAARLDNPSIDVIDHALYSERKVFRHHAMRRTLWVMGKETIGAAHASCTLKIADAEERRFLAWLEDTPSISRPRAWLEMATERIVDYLSTSAPASTREIGLALPDLAEPVKVALGTRQETTIPGHSRALLLAALNGIVVRTRPRGTWIASNYIWDTARRWGFPALTGQEPAQGTAELLVRVLDRFGPCTLTDLKWWTGWTLTMTRRALADISAAEVALESGATGWMNASDVDDSVNDPGPWIALLPGLDPTTMGWKERDWYLATDVAAHVFDRNGNAGPTIWADGQVVGGWAQRANGEIAFDLHRELTREHRALLADAESRTIEFVGDTRFSVRFPSPNQKRLLSTTGTYPADDAIEA
ncbi:MAG: winged helix DNA-binding domain-containing protein [Acidimicrobiia bacterium]